MADFDRRPRRGGGGGGGGFGNRKRRYREDDDGYDRRQQRRRYEDPPAVALRKQVLSIAESPVRRVEDDVSMSAKAIADNYFDTDLTNGFLDLAVNLTIEQPLKIPFIAAIVLLTNTQKPEFTTEILKRIGEALQRNIELGQWRDVKLFLRFLACLQGLFEGDGIFTTLEEIFSRAADLQTESSEDALGLELVKIILLTIPYTMASSASGFQSQAESLLEKTDIIASTPHILENLVDPFPSAEKGAPTSQESALALLQKHMTAESKDNWELSCLPRPWKIPRTVDEEDPLPSATKHPFPNLTFPPTLRIGPRQIFPEIYFSVYGEQGIETVPLASDPAALLIRDVLNDAINVMHYNRNIAGKALIDMDCYFGPETFVKRATPFDKLREAAGEKPGWKPEDVVVDATFAQLMQLPLPEHKFVYYHSVLTEACKIAPAAVAPSLGRAIRYLYRNVGKMDLELSARFLDWFAHHLSNFGFTWKWTEWIEDVDLPDVHPKKAFIIDALDKECRLSFAQRIKGTLPEPYQALIPPEKEKDSPDFKYNDPKVPFSSLAQELMSKIRTKAEDEEIVNLLNSIEDEATAAGIKDPKRASTDAFMTSICFVGSKSLSHALAVIERCRDRLLAISNQDNELRKQIITSVMDFWHFQIGTAVFLVDKLLNYSVLTPSSVVEWCLIDHVDRGTVLSKYWCYEVIQKTVSKVVGRVKQVVHKIRDPRLNEEERNTLQTVLEQEMSSMKTLFAGIEDAVSSIAAGSEDGMIESSDALRAEDESIIKAWGQKWVRVFRRRAAVEESWVREEIAKPLPELEESETIEDKMNLEEKVNHSESNGHGRGDERNGENDVE